MDDLLGTSSPDNKDFIKKSLKELFSFRDYLEDQDEFEFLGVSVKKEAHGGHSCGHDNYLAKLKPITLDKGRMADPESPASDKERKQLRALLGALQWAATQTSPHLQTMTSMLAGEVPKAKISTILAANKMLRFAKSNSDIRLQYAPLGATVEEVTFVAYSDAAFASRTDLSSQGGYMICLSPRKVLEGTVCGYHLLDWRPFKLPRVARSTLAAEGQAASEAADCLHFAVVFWKAMLDPEFRISEVKPETYRWWSPCALIVDAKCLYDLLHREELYVSTAADKRTCLEALTTRDKLREIGGEARWVSSERQYADGLTKDSATQLLADRLRTHMHKIVADDTYQASRKKTAVDRQRSAQQFAQPKAGWTGRAAAFAAAALTVASQPAPTEAHRDDDVSGALTYYVPQTYSDYCETGYYIFLPILVIIFFIYVHPTSAIQRLITFTWWTRTTRITNDVATQTEDTASATTFTETRNRWCQTDSALLHSPPDGRRAGSGPSAGKGLQPAACSSCSSPATSPELPYGVSAGAPPHRRPLCHAPRPRMALQRGLRPQPYHQQCADPVPVLVLHKFLEPSTASAASSSTTTVFAISGETGGS